MQKKFLRTSVLTLVMGLSLLTASHAMDPDWELERTSIPKITMRINSYQKESTECNARMTQLQMRGASARHGAFPGLRHEGPFSGLTHDREKSGHGGWKSSKTGIHVPGCLACQTLDAAVSAMVREKKVYDARDFL